MAQGRCGGGKWRCGGHDLMGAALPLELQKGTELARAVGHLSRQLGEIALRLIELGALALDALTLPLEDFRRLPEWEATKGCHQGECHRRERRHHGQ